MPTRLDIINDMLASTGTALLAAENANHPSYVKANAKLTKVSYTMQSRGWWFNKAIRTMRMNTAGEVIIPNSALHVDPVDTSLGYVVRGGKLYNLNAGSFIIGTDVQVVFVDEVAIPDLPSQAFTLIQARAVYDFYVDANGGEPKLSAYRAALQDAEIRLAQEHLRNADVNFFSGASYAAMARSGAVRRLPR